MNSLEQDAEAKDNPVTVRQAPDKDRVYWPQLDGLRSIAFLMVYMSHLVPLKLPETDSFANHVVIFINTAFSWGWIGVELFFVLSAFLITTLLLQERAKYGQISFKYFFIRRVLRIWPLYYSFLGLAFLGIPLVGSLYAAPFGSNYWIQTVKHYLGPSLVFLFNFSLTTDGTYMPSFFQRIHWSVAMEEQFYLVWGLVLFRVKTTSTLLKIVTLSFLFTIALRASFILAAHNHHLYYYNTFSHLDSILVGILLAIWLAKGKLKVEQVQKFNGPLLWTPVIFYLLLCLFAPPIQSNSPIYIILFTLIAGFCGSFVLAILHGQTGKRLFSHPLLVHMGRLTYAMYLFHMLGQQIAMTLTEQWAGPITSLSDLYLAWAFYALFGLLLTFFMAFISWHLLEKGFYNLRYRFSRIPSGFSEARSTKE